MTKKFAVEIVETYTQVVEISAEDAEAAVEQAEELVNDDVIQPEVYYDDYDQDCRVVEEVAEFSSLHEAGGDFSLNEIPDTLKDGCVYEYESMDGFTYSWRMWSHVLAGC